MLKGFEISIINEIVLNLNSKGIVLDEEVAALSSNMIERWSNDCDLYLRDNGFLGGNIRSQGKYFKSHGAVYALVDERRHDYDSAELYIQEHVDNYVL